MIIASLQGSITNSMGMADAIALKLDTLEEALKHESTSKVRQYIHGISAVGIYESNKRKNLLKLDCL